MTLRFVIALVTFYYVNSFKLGLNQQVDYRYNRYLLFMQNNANIQENEEEDVITVRYTNTISGKDLITNVRRGENLLFHSDKSGIALPRACRTGLCGSCTVDIKDSTTITSDTSPREGFATIRACSARCFVPQGEKEMVVDVYRLSGKSITQSSSSSSSSLSSSTSSLDSDSNIKTKNPMARFGDNWEAEFKPQWELNKPIGGRGGKAPNIKTEKSCPKCKGTGRSVCYNCEGSGTTIMADGRSGQCPLCSGKMSVACAPCRGRGILKK